MKARFSIDRPCRSVPVATDGPWSDLIGRRYGIALRDAQVPVLAALLQARTQALGLTLDAYYDVLEAEADGGPEWTDLMDRLVSHETSFFRHMPSFDAIRTHVVPDLRGRSHVGANALTFWSAGCSTGQEAYSLAMAAMDDEAVGGQFTVWGADISRRAIETARRGRYGERAVAAIPRTYRDRFLRSVDDNGPRQYEVVEALRQRVRFVSVNLYTASAMFLNYDVIVCQNVLIYFSRSAIAGVVSMLGARLNPGGYLLLGPGESPPTCPTGLEAINVNGVRAFRRVGRTAPEVRS